MNKQEDLIEVSVVKEESLKEVTGGEGSGAWEDDCYFEHTVPIRSEWRGGSLWVECRSWCNAIKLGQLRCSCWDKSNCVGRMHKVEKVMPRVYHPERYGSNNHREKNKAVVFDKEPG